MNSPFMLSDDRVKSTDVDVSEVLSQANELITLAAEHRAARNPRKTTLRQTITRKIDDLLALALPVVEEAPDVCEVFSRNYAMTEDDIGRLPRELLPLAVMRELLGRHKVVFDHGSVQNWDRFARLYQGIADC